ncbi:MAG: hypothetical protein P1V20_23590 [Verrucomicrobiales bacterium]|nr:hypothetical protein [Verrucomicrobiales bacterium]
MKLFRISQYFTCIMLITVSLTAQEHERRESGWSNLPEEDQKKLREALRTVWSDPIVLSARENVNRSAREYQQAVRDTIKKQDPETARLLERVQRDQTGFLHTAMGSNGKKKHIHGASVGRLSQMVAPPGMLDKMSEEQKQRFKEAATKARQQPDVIGAIEELKALSNQDEEIRRKKLDAFRKFRKAYFDAIAEIDPELKMHIPPPGPPPSYGGKGKGKPGKPPGPRRPELDSSPDKRPERPEIEKDQTGI